MDLAIQLSIAQAPASFAVPVLPDAQYDLPFKATLRIASTRPFHLDLTVCASVLTAQEVAAAEFWVPPTPHDPRLAGSEITGRFQLINPEGMLQDGRVVYRAEQDYVFRSLRFAEPSHGKPVFLAFHVKLPGAGPFLFTVFLIPTVVYTPGNIEEPNAGAGLLWRDALPPRPAFPSRWTFPEFCAYVNHELQEVLDLSRGLSPLDLMVLAHRAGFFFAGPTTRGSAPSRGMAPKGPRVSGGPTTNEEIFGLQMYIRRTQALLKLLRLHYESVNPRLICGFSVGRAEAVNLLQGQPVGTFILRFSYEAGALAMSVVQPNGDIHHLKYTLAQLHAISLEETLALSNGAEFLLDTTTGMRYPRDMVLERGYVSDAFVQIIQQQRTAAQCNPAHMQSIDQALRTLNSSTSCTAPPLPAYKMNVDFQLPEEVAEEGDLLPDQGFGVRTDNNSSSSELVMRNKSTPSAEGSPLGVLNLQAPGGCNGSPATNKSWPGAHGAPR